MELDRKLDGECVGSSIEGSWVDSRKEEGEDQASQGRPGLIFEPLTHELLQVTLVRPAASEADPVPSPAGCIPGTHRGVDDALSATRDAERRRPYR